MSPGSSTLTSKGMRLSAGRHSARRPVTWITCTGTSRQPRSSTSTMRPSWLLPQACERGDRATRTMS